MQAHATEALLILIAPPRLEEVLVDFLLQQQAISGFTSTTVSGHGTVRGAEKLSLVEQVSGRQGRVQFMLHAPLPVLQEIIAEIKIKFEGAGLHYMLLPVLAAQSV